MRFQCSVDPWTRGLEWSERAYHCVLLWCVRWFGVAVEKKPGGFVCLCVSERRMSRSVPRKVSLRDARCSFGLEGSRARTGLATSGDAVRR